MKNKKEDVVKINPNDIEPLVVSQRINYKLVDPTTVGSEMITLGIVVVEPGGVCEPGDSHKHQEEVFFCLDGCGIVEIGENRREIEITHNDALFITPGIFHKIKNPHRYPLTALWIISPGGWIMDKDPKIRAKAVKGIT